MIRTWTTSEEDDDVVNFWLTGILLLLPSNRSRSDAALRADNFCVVSRRRLKNNWNGLERANHFPNQVAAF